MIPSLSQQNEEEDLNLINLYTTEYILSKLNRERLDYLSFRFMNAENNELNKIDFIMMMSEIIPLHPDLEQGADELLRQKH